MRSMRMFGFVWAGIALGVVGLISVRSGWTLSTGLSIRLIAYCAIGVVLGVAALVRKVRNSGRPAPQALHFGQAPQSGQSTAPAYGWPAEQASWNPSMQTPPRTAPTRPSTSPTPIPVSMYEVRS